MRLRCWWVFLFCAECGAWSIRRLLLSVLLFLLVLQGFLGFLLRSASSVATALPCSWFTHHLIFLTSGALWCSLCRGRQTFVLSYLAVGSGKVGQSTELCRNMWIHSHHQCKFHHSDRGCSHTRWCSAHSSLLASLSYRCRCTQE